MAFSTINDTDVINPTAVGKINTNFASAINKDGTVPFTGNQSMGSNRLTSLLDPSSAQDAATKNYVDTTVGSIGFISTTSSTGSIGVSPVDLSGLSVTMTVPSSSRRVKVTGNVSFQGGTADASFQLFILEDGVIIGETRVCNRVSGNLYTVISITCKTSSSGSHTYKLQGAISAGTTATAPNASFPDFILVELI